MNAHFLWWMGLWLLAVSFSSCSFHPYSFCLHKLSAKVAAHDTAIVPAFPYLSNSGFQWVTTFCLPWNEEIYQRDVAENILCSGAAFTMPYVEGNVMEHMLENMDIPAENVYAETPAKHKLENIFNRLKRARKKGFRQVAVSNDPFQIFSLLKYVSTTIPKIGLIPLVFEEHYKDKILPYIASKDVLDQNYRHLRLRKTKQQMRESFKGLHLHYSSMLSLLSIHQPTLYL